MENSTGSSSTLEGGAAAASGVPAIPQLAVLDYLFPGFSIFANAVHRYLKIDLNLYIPLILLAGMLTVAWDYASSYIWDQVETYFMSVVDIRPEDEIYSILMAWVASQNFSQGARRFVVNTDLSSLSRWAWRWQDDDDDEDDDDSDSNKNKKALSYTPSLGSHYFFYRGRLLLFKRTATREGASAMTLSEREEISLSCFGRNPWILKELIHEARQKYLQKDEHKTLIYRGTTRPGSLEPSWQRCLARTTRPFSTVILNEKTKQNLIDDVTDYLSPATQRWYSNRGIPYRRGYLLHGPPGTGKSSLSLALAGFFKMRIYMVSLNSITANEESLASLFAELPKRCVVLLEDIDTAGLTHTREIPDRPVAPSGPTPTPQLPPSSNANKANGNIADDNTINTSPSRMSLSGLLNILDGVASQEGRVLIMTTNHLEKLDKALIRPGRVDMIVHFGLADKEMTASIFRAIFSHLEGDDGPEPVEKWDDDPEARKSRAEEKARKRAEADAHVEVLAEEFAAKVPAHEFSPAELQGYLLKNKRDPKAAVAGVDEFVAATRKDRREKELKEAEEKRKADEEKEKKRKEETKVEGTQAAADVTELTAPEKLQVKIDQKKHPKNDSGYATPTSAEP